MKQRILSLLIAGAITAVFFIQFGLLSREQQSAIEKANRLVATQEIASVASNIQTVLNLSMQYAEFFEVLIKSNPDISIGAIEHYASSILENNPMIGNVSIAPDGIVKFIYPLEGNESALGHNLMEDPERAEFMKRAIETKKAIAQGPVEAIQGGIKIFNRKPIFVGEGDQESFWGFAVIVINFDEVLNMFQLYPEKDGYLFALKVEATNGFDDFLWGSTEILKQDAMKSEIAIPGGVWEFAVYPKNGWLQDNTAFKDVTRLIYTMLIIVFVLSFYYIKHYLKIMDFTRKDAMTNALNHKSFRNFVDKQLKQRKQLALIIIDLDKFKEINDTYGHPVGDEVIKEAVRRINHALRETDKLARIGGDEFAVYIDEGSKEEVLSSIERRIRDALAQPMMIDHHVVNVKFSIGHAISERDGHSYGELYSAADKKMYMNKNANKLRTIDTNKQI